MNSVFSKAYWKEAYAELKKPKMLVLAGILIAIRVVLKNFQIPVGEKLNITFGYFVNALGAMAFGPVVAGIAAVISDTLGAIIFPQGPYFFPYLFVEVAGSVIFALMLYKRKLTVSRIILSRFLVILVCNLIMTPPINMWYSYIFYSKEPVFATLFTLPRLIKNISLFPLEATLLTLFISAMKPGMESLKMIQRSEGKLAFEKKHIILIIALFIFSVAVLIVYYKYLITIK